MKPTSESNIQSDRDSPTCQTDRQTNHAIPSVAIGRIYAIVAMRPSFFELDISRLVTFYSVSLIYTSTVNLQYMETYVRTVPYTLFIYLKTLE